MHKHCHLSALPVEKIGQISQKCLPALSELLLLVKFFPATSIFTILVIRLSWKERFMLLLMHGGARLFENENSHPDGTVTKKVHIRVWSQIVWLLLGSLCSISSNIISF